MKRRKALACFLFLLIACVASAAEDNFERITSEAQLTEGAICLITYKDDVGYRNMKWQYYPNGQADSILMFESTRSYTSLSELKRHTLLFKVVRRDGHWLLQNTENERFVGEVNTTVAQKQQYLNLFLHSKTPDDKFFLGFKQQKKGIMILIGSKSLRYNADAESFRLMAKSNTTRAYAELYCVSEGKPETILQLDPRHELGEQNFTGTVRLDRTFEDGYYNTLILPFEVSRPQDVFGSATYCLKPSSTTGNTITFTKMSVNESLKANTPYLLYGTFATPPYTFQDREVRHQKADSVVRKNLGSITLHGVYKVQEVGQSKAFILFQKGFYACKDLKSMQVEPYKWYLTCNQSNEGKLTLMQIDGETLIIQGETENHLQDKSSLYTLQGIKIRNKGDDLPPGIYIQGRRKIIKY